jgi:hypothetical protein
MKKTNAKKKQMKKNEVFYELCVDDIQEVAEEKLDRELTPEEIKYVEDHVGDYISWYDAISYTIDELLYRRRDK